MKKLIFASTAILFTTPLFALAALHTVKMKSISYEPRKLEITVGDTVEWQNVAYTEHSATSDEKGTFDTGLVAPQKKSKPVVFSKPGTFFYSCAIHGKTMRAEIVVTK